MATVATGVPPTLLALWRKVRQLFPVYAAISGYFHLTPPPCADIAELERMGDDAILNIAGWIDEIDEASQPHHLRTALQELDIASSDLCLSMWLHHFISKPVRGAADRDKIDFLLSHYLRMNLPPSLQEGKPNYAAMKAVLEPVLGACEATPPEEAREVEELIGISERCRSLAEFEQSGIIRRGRELKLRAGESYFTAPFLLAFTHFNAVVRRECGRLLNSDLKFIGDALDRLDKQGVSHVDCTAANWSDHEPVVELKNKWATWEMAITDYSNDFFATLIGFRNAMEEALDRSVELSMTSVAAELRSIHGLLLEMRKQIDELPRKMSSAPAKSAAPVPAVKPTAMPVPASKSAPVAQPAAAPAPRAVVAVAPAIMAPIVIPKAAASRPVPAMAEPAAVKVPDAAPKPADVPPVATVAKPLGAAVAMTAPKSGNAVPSQAVQEFTVCPPVEVVAPEPSVKVEPAASAPVAQRAPQATIVPVPEATKPAITDSSAKPEPTPVATHLSAAAQPELPAATAAASPVPATNDGVAITTPPPPDASNPASVDLETGIERLQKTLAGKRPAAVSIAVAGTRVLLTGAEASMFSIDDGNKFAKGVQRAVMMRICLVSALENYSKTRDKGSIAMLVSTARGEQSSIRDLIVDCKNRKLSREDEILSASAKQLSAMLERAERIAR